MNRKLLCYGPLCYPKHIKHDRNDLVIGYNHKHYCHKCYLIVRKRERNRCVLYQYIIRNARVVFPTPIMRRDIKKLRGCNYTYQGILNALKYANSHSMKFSFKGQFFLRYVPYVYEQAQKWQYKRDTQNDLTIDNNPLNDSVQTVSVKHHVFDERKKDPHYKVDKTILN